MKTSQSKELIYLTVINSFLFVLKFYDNFNSGIDHNIQQNSSFSQELICPIP